MQTKWSVILVGGASGAGKSHLAQQIAERYKISHMEADDVRIALRTVTNREQHPELFTFVDNQNYLEEFTESTFIEKHLETGSVVWAAVDSLVTRHVIFDEKIVIDGDSIIPDLLAQRDQQGIQAIFLYDDLEHIRERQIQRNRNKKRTQGKIETNAKFSYAYSEVLRAQAEKHGFKTFKVSPVETLFDRITAALEAK
jgi:2-phosphoglycerate kinase